MPLAKTLVGRTAHTVSTGSSSNASCTISDSLGRLNEIIAAIERLKTTLHTAADAMVGTYPEAPSDALPPERSGVTGKVHDHLDTVDRLLLQAEDQANRLVGAL